jgi:hypothetical protein
MFDLIFFDLILATLPQKVRLIAERPAEVCIFLAPNPGAVN